MNTFNFYFLSPSLTHLMQHMIKFLQLSVCKLSRTLFFLFISTACTVSAGKVADLQEDAETSVEVGEDVDAQGETTFISTEVGLEKI